MSCGRDTLASPLLKCPLWETILRKKVEAQSIVTSDDLVKTHDCQVSDNLKINNMLLIRSSKEVQGTGYKQSKSHIVFHAV